MIVKFIQESHTQREIASVCEFVYYTNSNISCKSGRAALVKHFFYFLKILKLFNNLINSVAVTPKGGSSEFK